MTDLLGECLSWDGTTCVVQPRDGSPVSIPIADIVSGKPVPPRPSVRLRVSTAEAEAHTAALFPGVETSPLGGWTLRWEETVEGRARKRANSCLAVADPQMPAPEALARVAAFYGERDRPAYVQVEVGSPLAEEVAGLGWEPVPGGDADFLLTSAALLRRELRGVDGPVEVAEVAEDGPYAMATIGDGVGEWARARGGIDGDWLGIHAVYVDPHHRRQGLAKQLMAELLDWGAERGARTVWLHVETDNAPALALYEGLEFTRHHTCRYFTPA
jgi:ribosomal protein S18 acetylase RimI-like enzyme